MVNDPLNVYQKFNLACSIIDGQAWVADLKNSAYKSIPVDRMREGVRKACVKAGLVHVGPYDIEYEHTVNDRTHRWVGTCKFRYVNIDDPEQIIEFESVGEAMDNGDKGIGKFITNLIKNHYKAAFDIGEQNEDDVDSYSNEEYEAKVEKQSQDEKNKARVKACKDAINSWLDDDPLINASSEIIADYVGRFGKFEEWKGGTIIQCYKELRDAKAKGLKEVSL